MDHFYYRQFNNVVIRPLKKEDIEHLRLWRNDEKNCKYLQRIPFITESMQQKWYENYLANGDELIFAIEEVEDLNRLVGSFSLYNFKDDSVEFGKFLIGDKEAHGRHIGLRAIQMAIEIVFNDMLKKRLYLHVYKENVAAYKIYKKIGFVETNSNVVNEMEELTMEYIKKGYND